MVSPGPARPTAPHGKGDPGARSSARAGTASVFADLREGSAHFVTAV